MTKKLEVENAQHIAVLNNEMSDVKADVIDIKNKLTKHGEIISSIETNVCWLKKEMGRLTQAGIGIFFLILGAFISKIFGMW